MQVSHVGWCVSMLGTRVSCAKTAEPIEIPFGWLIHVGPKNHFTRGHDRTNSFADARGDTTAKRPLTEKARYLSKNRKIFNST